MLPLSWPHFSWATLYMWNSNSRNYKYLAFQEAWRLASVCCLATVKHLLTDAYKAVNNWTASFIQHYPSLKFTNKFNNSQSSCLCSSVQAWCLWIKVPIKINRSYYWESEITAVKSTAGLLPTKSRWIQWSFHETMQTAHHACNMLPFLVWGFTQKALYQISHVYHYISTSIHYIKQQQQWLISVTSGKDWHAAVSLRWGCWQWD